MKLTIIYLNSIIVIKIIIVIKFDNYTLHCLMQTFVFIHEFYETHFVKVYF